MRLGTSLAVAVFALAHAASAQSLPQWTGELTVGEGRHTARAGNTLFFDDYGGLMRVGLSYRITGTGPRAAYVKLDYVTDGDFADNLVCAVTPAGGCYQRFHAGHGGSTALGVRQRLVGPLVVGAAAGIGQYGGSAGGAGVRPYVEGEISLHVLPHVAVMGLGRYVRWSAGENTYWVAPLMAGIQIH